ncbi:peptide/nickel transport system permease protein [Geodermatophilus amargosae]|uniref:Peptide/nickel transport system permease protein n=1 Tax=Geodermatophilus amargosae TaxID=1296565 RepID=A0A1I7D287_9ACTN|nr:ABC transporter permease [Geodermatophilus amargosae]SFU05792.1 peptide/nickel transport system permease protein [Geodermatophilus amargosae]
MLMFIGRKLAAGLVLFIAVTFVTFLLVFSNGEESVRNNLGELATEDQIAQRVNELNLDQPVLVQYVKWLGSLLTGSLGRSFNSGETVTSILATRIPVTLSIIFLALLVTSVLSIAVGVVSAVKGGWVDRSLQFLAGGAAALPSFLVAIALTFLFAIALPIFPATGYVPFGEDPGRWATSLVLPIAALVIHMVANSAQQFRGAMVDALKQDYIRTLRSRGVPERAVVLRHALRNAAAPGLTILSVQTIGLVGGAVLIEQIFALPGVGQFTIRAAIAGDLPSVMGVVVFGTLLVLVVNILADVVNAWINPRVRLS